MAEKLSLENAGDNATFTITTCRTVNTKYGDRIVFAGTDDNGSEVETPLIPDKTALRQLERIGLTTETVVGERLTFSRAHNPSGKPYWNLDPVSPTAPASKRLSPPPAQGAPASSHAVKPALINPDQMQAAYLTLWDRMAQGLSVSAATHKIPITADAVQAATATLWIALNNRGFMFDAYQKATSEPSIPTTPAPSGKRLAPPKPDNFDNFPAENSADDDLPF